MKALILCVAWLILLVISWPVALLVLVLAPFLWLLSLPFRLLDIFISAAIAFIKALLFLPAWLLGYRA